MGLALKQIIQQDIAGGSIWVTGNTGEYDVDDNDSGWGTPNEELNESALVWSIVRNELAGKVALSSVTADALHNAAWVNDDINTVEFVYGVDGWHSITFFRLPVSSDDVNLLDGGTLIDLQYYFHSGQNEVRRLDATVPITGYSVITDYEPIKDDSNVIQLTCEDMYYNKVAIKANDLYKVYRDIRDTKGGECNEAKIALNAVLDIREDIRGADYAFRSGNTTEAQSIIETVIARYSIT